MRLKYYAMHTQCQHSGILCILECFDEVRLIDTNCSDRLGHLYSSSRKAINILPYMLHRSSLTLSYP